MARFLWMTLLATALLCLGACDTTGPDDDDDTTAGDDDTTADDDDDDTTPTDDDDDTTADDDDDDTTEERLGLAGKLGAATALNGTYDGYEELYFVAEKGEGDDVCRIHYAATSVAERTDCADCDWAFDLRFTGPSITAETDVGCLPTLGYDANSVNDIDGTSVAYGYIAEYFGHAQVMTLYTEATDSWDVVTFASWDPASGEFSYDWEDTYYPY